MNKRQRKKRDKKIRRMAKQYASDFLRREAPAWPGTERFVELYWILKADLRHKFRYDIELLDNPVTSGYLGFCIKPM